MGTFRIEITATGGHGCDRTAKEGDAVRGCGRMGCPDCELRRFLESPQFRSMLGLAPGDGRETGHARLVHWPGTAREIVDEYTPGAYGVDVKRIKGSF